MTTSAWESTRQRSRYHFDNFRMDPQQDRVIRLGSIQPFWLDDLASIVQLAEPKTWRTRGQGADRPAEEYDQEDYDLEQQGYGRDYIVSDLTWAVPAQFDCIDRWFAMDNSRMRLHVQHPGQVWNLHLDKLEKWHPEDPSRVMRVMVALTDWEPGHFFSYGNYTHTQWRAGEVTTFDWLNLPHATANAGHHPRITLQLTGVRTEQTDQFLTALGSEPHYQGPL
jgi:hypothetical protein